jgi:hypothetical protein
MKRVKYKVKSKVKFKGENVRLISTYVGSIAHQAPLICALIKIDQSLKPLLVEIYLGILKLN